VDCRVQLALDGAFRKAERLGDLSQFQALMVAHREDETLPRWQPRDLIADMPL